MAGSSKVAPWFRGTWRGLFADEAKLHHALLIAGPEGIGKLDLAEAICARLLCEAPPGQKENGPCGVCQSCRWLAAGNHPDFRRIVPEADEEGDGEAAGAKSAAKKKPSAAIKIDQVRALEDFVYVGSHRHGNRVVLIAPAEAMNAAATNSLLKILEEPPAGVHFVIVSTRWRRLLPTVRSRCRILLLGRPEAQAAREWLKAQGIGDADRLLAITGGAPVTAARWATEGQFEAYQASLAVLFNPREGLLAMAARWDSQLRSAADTSMERLVDTVQKWVIDLIQVKLAGRPRYHGAWRENLDRLAAPAGLASLFACYNELHDMRAVANHPLNPQLFLEDLAARYLRALRPDKA